MADRLVMELQAVEQGRGGQGMAMIFERLA